MRSGKRRREMTGVSRVLGRLDMGGQLDIYRLHYGSKVTIGTVRVTLWISVRVVQVRLCGVRVRT
jgi:hypothetical protein